MKSLHVVTLLVGLVLGLLLATQPRAGAQARPADAPRRYQVSAFSSSLRDPISNRETAFHGCYLLDTDTGEVWLNVPGQKQVKVGEAPGR